MTKAQIDREWPHQVAVSAQFIRGRNHTIIDRFCRGLSVCPRHHYYERNGECYVVYCFAERMEAEFSRCTSTVRSWTPRRGRGGPTIARALPQPTSATETAAA
jgi:hypothetical protein